MHIPIQASQTGERYPDWVPGLVLLLGFLSMMGLQVVAETMSQGDDAHLIIK